MFKISKHVNFKDNSTIGSQNAFLNKMVTEEIILLQSCMKK